MEGVDESTELWQPPSYDPTFRLYSHTDQKYAYCAIQSLYLQTQIMENCNYGNWKCSLFGSHNTDRMVYLYIEKFPNDIKAKPAAV